MLFAPDPCFQNGWEEEGLEAGALGPLDANPWDGEGEAPASLPPQPGRPPGEGMACPPGPCIPAAEGWTEASRDGAHRSWGNRHELGMRWGGVGTRCLATLFKEARRIAEARKTPMPGVHGKCFELLPCRIAAPHTRRTAMSILVFLIVGLVAGLIARALVPGRQSMGWVMTMLLGIVGSLVGGFLVALVTSSRVFDFNTTGLIGSIVGAIVVLAVSGFARNRIRA